jgi:hypothetical protein
VDTVVNSGPGLVFITYPEVVLKLPGGSIWAIIFFFMLVVRTPPPLPPSVFYRGFTAQTLLSQKHFSRGEYNFGPVIGAIFFI